ncbi:MAG: EF-hand domain-containing protein [Stigonema ocellatum SAG 48.90 = DSM 106950]|nr:EF-hand domain-containing protein [Stigonema ocellatum SAG 48.90 = DSM 106950]
MLANISERQIHRVRWVLSIGWLILIVSLFYDPITSWLTYPENTLSPLKINLENCVIVQGSCLKETPYALGAPIFWGVIVPSSIFILLVFGHEFWRRICPLSFISQIPRALKWQRQKKNVTQKTDKVKNELVKVAKNSWLFRNAIYLQCGLFFLGLCSRILFVNSNRLALGIFLLGTIVAAIVVGYLYGGKSWCHYFCPMAPVQKIYGEPRGLLNSTAHEGDQQKITQSMCRTLSKDGKELSACVACNSHCMDIDAERSYWENITQPDQQWLYYSYVGITIGYFAYYYLYAGNWNYYTSGVWAHEENQWATLLKPGLYLFGQAIPIPKLVTVPLTLGIFALGGYWVGKSIEKRYKAHLLRKRRAASPEIIRHRIFTVSTFFIFNFFFIFAGRNYIRLLPNFLQYIFPILIATCSTLWLYRTWGRGRDLYLREGLTNRLRKQLQKLNLDTSRFLEGRSLDELSSDEVYVLAKVLPGFDKEKRLQMYKVILRDALDEGSVDVRESLENFKQMRLQLDISDQEHETIITELGTEYPELFSPTKSHSRENLLRLASYRETLLETILSSWHDQPNKAKITELLKAFTEKFSTEALENVFQTLSPEDLKIVHTIRQQYGITPLEEEDALKHTVTEQLWRAIVDKLGLLDNLDSEEKILELFQKFDADNSGYITLEELKLCIRNLDSNVTDIQIEQMFRVADTSGDKQISYKEFSEVLAAIGCSAVKTKN